VPVTELSAADARRMALRAQGLLGAPARREGVPGLLKRLAAVQLDTISVLARSHELVPYARLGPVGREAVERAYWSGGAFEYWAHAACLLPVEQWPLFAFRRRHFRDRGRRWHSVPEGVGDEVLARLRADGPLTAGQLGGAKRGGPWWDWSAVKVAVEWLLDVGEVVCVQRRGFQRVYDLAERALPAEVAGASEPDDEACLTALVAIAGRALGVGTRADLADFHRIKGAEVARVAEATTLLSPFDSLVWARPRTERVFGFVHRLEAYVPAAKRVHGYFAMPLLTGGRLAGRVDPRRDGTTLVARRVTVEPRAVEPMAAALREAASWVGCDAVVVETVDPPELAAPLRARVA
jgi:uncharacterized protein